MGAIDIRWPIGVIFSLYGIILLIFGATTDPQIFVERSMGVNIDIWWGVAMLAFGVIMGFFAFVASRRSSS